MRDVTNWKGSYRVPVLFWRGPVQPHSEINDIISAEGWVQTLMAAAGEPDIQTKLLHAYNTGDKSFKVHLDGYDQRDVLAGKGPDGRRESFIGPTTVLSRPSATTNTRQYSWNRRHTG